MIYCFSAFLYDKIYTLFAFLHKDSDVISAIPIPSVLTTKDFSVALETNYPFENKLNYIVDAKKAFNLIVRIPSFAENITINGKTANCDGNLTFDIKDGEQISIQISFDTNPVIMDRPHNLKTVKCGSLVFSVPIKYEKKMMEYVSNNVERKFPYCDYEYIGLSDWNYGYADDHFEVIHRDINEVPFSSEHPAIVLKAKVKKIDWRLEDGFETVCAKIPNSTEPIGEEEEIELYPYGCAKLRMTEIPRVE